MKHTPCFLLGLAFAAMFAPARFRCARPEPATGTPTLEVQFIVLGTPYVLATNGNLQ